MTQLTPTKKPQPDLTDELWTNAHLKRYFLCGTTTVCQMKKKKGFPAARQIGGLQRYVADQVRAFALGNPSTPTTAETQSTKGAQS